MTFLVVFSLGVFACYCWWFGKSGSTADLGLNLTCVGMAQLESFDIRGQTGKDNK